MPELPDLTATIEALEGRVLGRKLEAIRLAEPFVPHTVELPREALAERRW